MPGASGGAGDPSISKAPDPRGATTLQR
jgi:hypothetical protein